MAQPTAEWTGVVVLGGKELDCRLFSALGHAKPLPLKLVHTTCRTRLEAPPEAAARREPEETEAPETPALAQVGQQLHCPRCARPLKADEVSRAVETEAGLILLRDDELASLTFQTAKRVVAEFIRADDEAVDAVGYSRRLFILPKPAALETYGQVFAILHTSQRLGFVSPWVVKGKAQVAVIRPLVVPPVIFGAERRLLVVDMLNDTDRCKDPALLPGYPGSLPELKLAALAEPIAEAQRVTAALDPERCVNPKRRRLKAIIQQALIRALQR